MAQQPPVLEESKVEVQPLAFTVQFDDSNKKLHIHDKLSKFALKHRRNPSLPEFVSKKCTPVSSKDKKPLPASAGKIECFSEGYFSISDQEDDISKNNQTKVLDKISKNNSNLSLERKRMTDLLNQSKLNATVEVPKSPVDVETNGGEDLNTTYEVVDCKSDTVSEAGTYTLDKDETRIKDADATPEEEYEEESVEEDEPEDQHLPSSYQRNHKWINEWVSQVAKQNFSQIQSGEESRGESPIPSPISTLPKIKKSLNLKLNNHETVTAKISPSTHHRRSASLSAKDYSELRNNDNETQSYLRTTESVVTAMQARMKISDNKEHQSLKQQFRSPTDLENDSDVKKKSPLPSTRLNRAFSLRRARAEPEHEDKKKKELSKTPDQKKVEPLRVISNPIKTKPPATSPFSRTDCGRFSTRTVSNTPKVIVSGNKKDGKKGTPGGRSNSSLSSREVEFQNWKRRKSFDPMKAAAEGRKKELAKKQQVMTQSVCVGTAVNPRSSGNPVLRSASFHSSPQQALTADEPEERLSSDDMEYSPGSSWVSNHPVLPPNSPTRSYLRAALLSRPAINNSRGSLASMVSATHSSPSRRAKIEALDNLVTTAISDLSYKLKGKSCTLLKKLSCMYETDDERYDHLQDEINILESQRHSTTTSPVHQPSRDLSAILKNLKSLENVLKVLDDVLFDENIEVLIDS